MVEQAHARKGHDHAILVALANDLLVAHRTAGLGHVGHAAAAARSMLSPKGKKASLPSETPEIVAK